MNIVAGWLQRTLPCKARVIKNRVASVYDKSQLSLKVNGTVYPRR